ncbi:MAG: CPBP family intramembrane metalloprotease [Lachnospiraceae bacterium]|nr:CPBP family intramembrane metalloprotease [Lachnospiraceae bacterium]
MVIKDMNEKKARIICLILTAVILIFAYIEEIYIQPGYLIKCIIKVSTFGGVMILYSALAKKKFLDIINLKKPEKIGILIGGIVLFFVGIGILFFIFKNQIEWPGIRQSLVEKEGLTKQNCFFAFAYIIIFNSFLEEAFFRGFLANIFSKKWVGYIISALLFSAYHIGIIGGWFNIPIFLICVIGLALVALFLQWLSVKYKTIVANWLVHASANVAINVIGTLLIFNVLK